MATTIAYANSNIAALRTTIVGNLEGRGASVPNLADKTVEQDTLAFNGSVCVWSAEAGFSGFVVSGLTYASASGLVATYNSGTAWILRSSTDPDQNRRIVVSTSVTVTLTASSDNYVYLTTAGILGAAVTTVDGPAPTLPADVILLSIATTDGTTVTGTPVDKRVTGASAVSKHWRSKGFWPVPTTTTNFRLPPGVIELEGTLFETTVNNDLDITQAGNFASGTRTSNAFLYFIAANNSGALKLALTMSAPSATTVVGGVTSGTAGRLQFRRIGGVNYRYLAAGRTSTTAVMKMFSRVGPDVMNNLGTNVLSTGTSTTSTAVSLGTIVPPTSRKALLDCSINPDGSSNDVFFKESSVAGAGVRINVINTSGFAFKLSIPTSSAQKIMYRVEGATAANLDVNGYTEELD